MHSLPSPDMKPFDWVLQSKQIQISVATKIAADEKWCELVSLC